MTLNSEKRAIIIGLFLEPADRSYALSRWSFHAGLYYEFFWNAAQALEKYLKACLLLNGKSVNGQRHNIEKLFDDFKEVALDLLPDEVVKPGHALAKFWYIESTLQFVKRFNELGDPNNRYAMIGHAVNYYDLEKLDSVVFAIRRLATCLDENIYPDEMNIAEPMSAWLRNNPSMAFPSTFQPWFKKYSNDIQEAVVAHNHIYVSVDEMKTQPELKSASANSAIYMQIFSYAENGTQNESARDEVSCLIDWINANVFLSKDFRKALDEAKEKLRLQY